MNKGRGKNHRIFTAFLCVCMLLTLPGLSDIFPAAAAGQEESFQQENIITAFSSLPKEVKEQTVSIGTDIDELKLPVELTVYLSRESSKQIEEESGQESTEQENNGGSDDIEENSDTENENGQDIQPKGSALFGEQEETSVISGVTWQSKPAYDGNTKGTYLFSAVLPESYTLAENVSLPEITVTVEDNGTDAVIQTLIGRIMALPDSEEYLAKEPDADNWEEDDDVYEKAYTEWMDGLYEYAGEALAIQEEYEALTEEEQAQIPQDMADKLAAWVEIAKQVAESGIMPAAANGTHVHNGITFQAWSKTNSLPTTAGNYYLTNDVTLNSYYEIPGNINLCLCGHKIEGSVSQGMIRVNRYALNIYDCQGAGRVYCSGINNPIQVSQNGVLSLYGGTVQAAERSAIPIGTGSGDNTGGTVNIYSGASVIGGTNGIYVNPNLQSSKVNIYGGTISGTPPINMKNGNGCITIYGDADISSISTVTSVIAAGAGQSGLSKTYTIAYTGVQNGTIVVKGSTDNTHYKLEHTTYTLCPENGNLTARVVYKVTLAGNGGSGTQLVSYGSGIETPLPTDWTKVGYTFGGWYENSGFTGNKVTSISATATGDKTYYAKWTANKYTVTYNKNSGTIANESNYTSYTYGTGLTLPTPTRTGYTFGGWYENSGFTGNKVTSISTTATGNKTYYAKWTANKYTVTYNKNSGTIANESNYTSYTYGTGLTLPVPTRTGYTFGGWYENSGFTGNKVTSISITAIGDKTYYAKWSATKYKITFAYLGATGGSTTADKTVTYDAAYGTLPAPEKTGYVFKGWYTSKNGQGTQVKTTTIVKTASEHTLYAYWKDETAPDAPVLQNGKTLPEGWTKTCDTIPLKLYDSVGVSRLLVSVDKSPYAEVSGFSDGTGSVNYDYAVSDGEHTYQFKAVDAAGNESEASSLFTLKLDKTKPVIGTITYENIMANLWDWIIGRTSMIVHVPVTDTGSGVSEISYTLTPEDAAGNSDSSYTAEVSDGEAEITFAADFRGTIAITCTDAVGNAADGVTIGANAGGVIVEDHAPKITVCADRSLSDMQQTPQGGMEVSEEYYDSSPALIVTVKDDTDNVITGGIAAITYQVGDGTEKPVTIDTSALQAQVTFTIPALEIPAGITEIMVMASDNAGNKTKERVTVKVKGLEKQPEAEIDYRAEKLTGLVPNGIYSINDTKITADQAGCISIEGSWLENTLNIVKKGNQIETFDSQAPSLSIPARPQKPAPTGVDVSTAGGTGKLIGLTAGVTYEVSADGGKTWMTKTADGSGEITGLVPGTYVVRVKATDFNFVSENSEPAAIGVYRVKVTFIANDETYKEILVDYEGTLTEIPSVPLKEDAGDQLYIGEWCSDGRGTPAVFTNITADMTVYAVYTTAYTVTLQGGTGYILSPVGSASPVKEGGSFTFCFALENGYQTTGSFIVKVNDEKVELTAEKTYTITDIRENQTVMVEGVEKKPTGGSSGPSGGGSFNPPDGGDNGDDPEPEPQQKPTPQPKPTQPKPKPESQPESKPTPQPSQSQQSSSTNPPEQPQPTDAQNNRPTDTQNNQPEDGQEPESTGTPEESEKPSETETEQLPNGGKGQTVPAAIDDGNIVVSGEAVATGNAKGMMDTSTVLELGEGAVIVTVVCAEQDYTAGVEDTVAVANTVLTPEQLELVNNGETIEIRIDVKDITNQMPEQDKKVIADGMEEYQKEVLGLTFGTYVDISMFIKIGEGDWNAITTTEEPIEIIIGIPEKLQEEGRTYYIIRAHDGEHTFMDDMDNEPGTITVSTDRFSSYAIAYAEAEKTKADDGAKCRLCHICPTFLGICYFVWLAIIILMTIIVIILFRKKKGRVCKED